MSKLIVRNITRGTIVADAAWLASTSAARRKGLLSRDSLAIGEGLWIDPCEGVHTIGMRFPIDVVFLSGDQKVLKIRKQMGPWRLSACLRASSVLEIAAGSAAITETQKGDQLRIEAHRGLAV